MDEHALELAKALLSEAKTHKEFTFSVQNSTDTVVVSVVRTTQTVRLVESARQLSISASGISTTGAGEICGTCNGRGKI